jgi:hypothetical protein
LSVYNLYTTKITSIKVSGIYMYLSSLYLNLVSAFFGVDSISVNTLLWGIAT